MANADNIVNKGLLLHGIGKGVLQTVSGKVLEMETSQSMKMEVNATSEEQYGGDSLFPLYTYISKKEGSVKIENAEFKLSQLSLAQGTTLKLAGNKRTGRVIVTKGSTELIDGTAMTGVEVIAVIGPDGQSTDALTVDATGKLTFGETAADGEYRVWYRADDANTVEASMLKNAMPEVATFNWFFVTEDSEGHKYQIDLYARRVRSDGKFSLDTARDKASTPELTVNILDPGDGKDDFAVIRITRLAD
ncbi:MAG: hypothetical protein SPL62_07910 [Selenomonas sp.]|nr:hypothetical protein [Selenomonas sp.]